jgi:hypothetical protein
VIGPFLLMLLTWIIPILPVILAIFLTLQVHPGAPPPVWLRPMGEALLYLVQFGGPLLIACGIALLGARQRSRLAWPILGCLLIALIGDSLHWVAHWPTAASHDLGIGLGVRGAPRIFLRGGSFSLAEWSLGLPLVALNLAAAAAAYVWTARKRAPVSA